MANILMEKTICRVIAQTYALNADQLWKIYSEVNSIDKLIQMIENKEIK